ncbi:MAG: cation-translocating P-type ATPase [Devosia sp.]|nr:cation-translocating P-type ATPase [Devosia sp.]
MAPGARLPVDGEVVVGHSFVDESRITGESMPVEKVAGRFAFAGTINQSGAIEIPPRRADRPGDHLRADLETVEEADALARAGAAAGRSARRLHRLRRAGLCRLRALDHRRRHQPTIAVIVVAGACGRGGARSSHPGRYRPGGADVAPSSCAVHLEDLAGSTPWCLDKIGTLTFRAP